MPEGDTVYRLAHRLDRRLSGHVITRSDLRHPRLATSDLSGRMIVGHETHGKHLLTRMSGGVTLHSHLRLDGEWTVTAAGRRLPSRLVHEVRLVLVLDNDETVWGLRLHDLALLPSDDVRSVIGHLGPDPLRDDWDPTEAVRRLGGDGSTPLVAALLDQTRMAGLGNLWVNELAFLVGADPWTPIGELDMERLVDLAATVLRQPPH